MRLFTLYRHEDPTNVSGTGTVAEGIEFSDGVVALRWCVGPHRSTVTWDLGIPSVLAVHGHDGKTVIKWHTPEGLAAGEDPAPDASVRVHEHVVDGKVVLKWGTPTAREPRNENSYRALRPKDVAALEEVAPNLVDVAREATEAEIAQHHASRFARIHEAVIALSPWRQIVDKALWMELANSVGLGSEDPAFSLAFDLAKTVRVEWADWNSPEPKTEFAIRAAFASMGARGDAEPRVYPSPTWRMIGTLIDSCDLPFVLDKERALREELDLPALDPLKDVDPEALALALNQWIGHLCDGNQAYMCRQCCAAILMVYRPDIADRYLARVQERYSEHLLELALARGTAYLEANPEPVGGPQVLFDREDRTYRIDAPFFGIDLGAKDREPDDTGFGDRLTKRLFGWMRKP